MEKKTLFLDDALWGFPLGGVLLGAYDSLTNCFAVAEIPVEYFKSPKFDNKEYLDKMADAAVQLLLELHATPDTHTVKVCQGYVNSEIPPRLRRIGYQVETGGIGEPLQSWLEGKAAEYIRNIGYDGYYDPKDMSEKNIRKAFWRVVNWVRKNNRYDIAKTGWKFWRGR